MSPRPILWISVKCTRVFYPWALTRNFFHLSEILSPCHVSVYNPPNHLPLVTPGLVPKDVRTWQSAARCSVVLAWPESIRGSTSKDYAMSLRGQNGLCGLHSTFLHKFLHLQKKSSSIVLRRCFKSILECLSEGYAKNDTAKKEPVLENNIKCLHLAIHVCG